MRFSFIKSAAIIAVALSVAFLAACEDPLGWDDDEGATTATTSTNAAFNITGAETGQHNAYATFSNGFDEFIDTYVFNIQLNEDPNITLAQFMLSIQMHSDTPITLEEGQDYPLGLHPLAGGGGKGSFGAALDWYTGDRTDPSDSAELNRYVNDVEGNMFISSVRSTSISGIFNLTARSVESGETITITTGNFTAARQN